MAALHCPKHPDYAVQRKPTGDCALCHRMWARRHAHRECANPACKRVFVWEGDSGTRYCSPECGNAARRLPTLPAPERVVADLEKQKFQSELSALRAAYAEALVKLEAQGAVLGWLDEIRKGLPSNFEIQPREGSGTSEATAVLVASDWHSEEIVKPAQVNGLNQHDLDINDRRITRFFQSGLRLIKLLNQDVTISQVLVPLLGDFITGQIHGAENAESNASTPIEAIIRVQDRLEKGFQFLLDHSKYDFVIPCKVGNHSRTTLKTRMASESGHSLESLMYIYLAACFRNEPRMTFVIEDGYHTYVTVYDKVVRFHHGHSIQYAGGIGGIFIPAFKAVSQWNKARHADLDVFGHFHQSKDGGNFICNGSLIGYNAFALRIKADYEPPSQTLFLIDKKRGRTAKWPVYV